MRQRIRAFAYLVLIFAAVAAIWGPGSVMAQVFPGGGPVGGGGGGVSFPVADTIFKVCDNGDSTKCYQVELSGITAANTTTPIVYGGTTAVPTLVFNGSSFAMTTGTNFVGWNAGAIGWGSASTVTGSTGPDAFFRRGGAAAKIQMGTDANGAVTAQQFTGANGVTGTDIAGGNIAFGGQVGTGAGAGSQTSINRALMLGTGTSAQSNVNGYTVCESKTLSNTTATTTTLVNIASASNSGGGAEWTTTVVATDATNFDVEQQTCNVGWVNKAGTFTVATPVCTATVAASNSGSTTVGATVTGATSVISVKATPVFTTIVPTTVTAYTTIRNNSPGLVTCQ